jgi:flagellar basal body rod protein FlgG
MSSFKIFDIAGTGMSAQSVRLNTTASNLANADSVSGDPNKVYKAKHPLFEAIRAGLGTKNASSGVSVRGIAENQAPPSAQQTRMTVTSNNLANVNTTGYKKSRAVFEDLLYQNVRQVGASTSQDTEAPTGLSLGTGVRVVASEKTYTQGNLSTTGNSLDGAISGRGFFQILLPDGTMGYTRDGRCEGESPHPPRTGLLRCCCRGNGHAVAAWCLDDKWGWD